MVAINQMPKRQHDLDGPVCAAGRPLEKPHQSPADVSVRHATSVFDYRRAGCAVH